MAANDANEQTGSGHLIAPELREALAFFPTVTLSDDVIAMIRTSEAPDSRFPALPLPDHLRRVSCEEHFVARNGDSPDVRVLLYTPGDEAGGTDRGRPAILHVHGGGYVMGAPEINDALNRQMVVDHGCVIVSVDYRLAPETKWPGALEDCYAALSWLHDGANDLGVDVSRIAIAGESAGGGHAAALAIAARDRGDIPIAFLLLDAPMLDDRPRHEGDAHPYTGEFVWTPASNHYGWSAMLGREAGGPDVPAEAVPARAERLEGLPPTFVSVGALDLFLEENLEFVRRLSRAGVPVELHVTPGAYHGFTAAAGSPQFEAVTRLRRDALARAFAGHI